MPQIFLSYLLYKSFYKTLSAPPKTVKTKECGGFTFITVHHLPFFLLFAFWILWSFKKEFHHPVRLRKARGIERGFEVRWPRVLFPPLTGCLFWARVFLT